MPFVDRIIQFLKANHGERIVIETDQPCVIYRRDGTGAPSQDRLNFSQLTTMLGEVMPDEHRFAYASGERVTFPYASPNGMVDLEVTQEDGNLRVAIGEPGTLDKPYETPAAPLPEFDPMDEPAPAASHAPEPP